MRFEEISPINGHNSVSCTVITIMHLFHALKNLPRPFCHPGRRFFDTCASNRIEIDPVFSSLKNRLTDTFRNARNGNHWHSLGLLSNGGINIIGTFYRPR